MLLSDDLALELDVVAEANPPPELDLDSLEPLARFVLRSEGATGRWSVALALVSDDRLRALHRDFMGIDTPTDVMTFPSGDVNLLGSTGGGDIVVSVDRAREQAGDAGTSAADEVRFLFVHGLLHLSGWNDASPEERTRMLGRGGDLLRAFDAA